MQNAWLDSMVAWIGANPQAAGALIFFIAFCDALIVVGIAVPALPLLFAVGTLIGLGHVDGPYALLCAAAGAFLGDALSYWVGLRWGPALRQKWPFARYPQLLDRGEHLFRRHGLKGIVIARFVGAVRPFVPAVAGMLRMPLKRYAPASAFAALSWAAVFLAPGWIFGTSYEAVAAVADRLALVLLALFLVLALIWACVLYTYRWFATHADRLLARALAWTRQHPRLGRYAASLVQPHRPESPALAVLAVCLLAIGWGWFALLTAVLAGGGSLALDHAVHSTMIELRTPLADRPLAALAAIGDLQVLLPALLAALAWLLWRRCHSAAVHWLAAVGFGLMFSTFLGLAIDMPKPAGAVPAFGFPAMEVTLFTIVFGFFAVLIARELPGRQRVWPYMVAGLGVALLGFARLYFGAHWLSDIVAGVLFGVAWLLVLGIAYRRHLRRNFWMRPVAIAFYGAFALAALWHVPRAVAPQLAESRTTLPDRVLGTAAWWDEEWATLPAHHDRVDRNGLWPLNVQLAGDPAQLQRRLESAGWRVQAEAGWTDALRLLDSGRTAQSQPVLPAALDARAERLLMRRPGATPDTALALRLWPASAVRENGERLWVGTAQTLRFRRPLPLLGLWVPEAAAAAGDTTATGTSAGNSTGNTSDTTSATTSAKTSARTSGHEALDVLSHALSPYRTRLSPHPDTGTPTLRVLMREQGGDL